MPEPVQRAPLLLTATADADGRAVVESPQVPGGYLWLVDYIVLACSNAAGAATATIYVSRASWAHLWDGTAAGRRAVASYVPARIVDAAETLVIEWTGLDAGEQVSARIEYREAVV